MAKAGPETKLIAKMRKEAYEKYGERLVIVKYHGSPFTQAGVSDLLGVLDGQAWACEVKAPQSYGNSIERALLQGPTIKQRNFIRQFQQALGVGWFAASVEQFMEGLDAVEWVATGEKTNLGLLVSGNLHGLDGKPLCTCGPEFGCEFDTDIGCLYCRTVPVTEPCPNLDGSDG